MKRVAFLGATMPFALPESEAEIARADLVVVPSEEFREIFLAGIRDFCGEVAVVPSSPFFLSLPRLMRIMISCEWVAIFHECCWPSLDIALGIVRPKGVKMPIVNVMESSKYVPWLEYPFVVSRGFQGASKLRKIMRRAFVALLVAPFFRYFSPGQLVARRWVQGSLTNISLVERTVQCRPIQDHAPSQGASRTSVIFAAGNADIPDATALREVAIRAAKICRSHGWRTILKDHPREANRLFGNLHQYSSAISIFDEVWNPLEPLEVALRTADPGPDIIMGFGSTALALSGLRAISLLALTNYGDEATRQEKHLRDLGLRFGNQDLSFPSDWADFSHILSEPRGT